MCRFLLLLLYCLPRSAAANADTSPQGQGSEPPRYSEALHHLAAGDTTRALALLRGVIEADPDFGPAYLRLGSVLSKEAGDLESEYELRLEAKKSLERAWKLMGDDPEVMLEYGLLLRRQRVGTDARRVLDRAWKEAERRGHELAPEVTARLHYTLGRIYEKWWEDWQELVMIPPTAERIDCPKLPAHEPVAHWDAAVYCPREWARQLPQIVSLADLKSDERERMVAHFRLALQADPTDVQSGLHLLGHLADAEEWTEYVQVARQLTRLSPDEARSFLFLGLGLHELGSDRDASTAFDRGLALLPPAERRIFQDIDPLLTPAGRDVYAGLDSVGRAAAARAFFASTDPLFLTDVSERRLEHYARVAWAELKFGDPTTGERGWDSERGQIWIRYGRPWRWYQCCYGSADARQLGVDIAGRRAYWSYGPDGPVFVFGRELTYRHALHTGVSKSRADDLERDAPESYHPTTVTSVYEMPHQLVRFRGEEPALTRVEIYAAVPVDSLDVAVGATVETGLFVFDRSYEEILSRKLSAEIDQPRMGLTYLFQVPPGTYNYGLEVRERGPENLARPVARNRDTLAVAGFGDDRLSVSDLLLADGIRALSERPTRREQLQIWPSRTLRFPTGEPVHVYFEVYGLAVDADELAHYRVELAVEDAKERNLVQKIARGIVELFARADEEEPYVAWERVVPISDDRSIEYVSVTLPQLETGQYRMRLRITDLATGEAAETQRVLSIESLD